MKKIILLTIVSFFICLVASTSSVRAEKFSFEEGKTFTVGKEGTVLKLDNLSGNITVESHSLDRVIIRATKFVKAKNKAQAEKVAGKIKIDIQQQSSIISAHTNYPQSSPRGFWEGLADMNWEANSWVDYQVLVPAKTELNLSSTSGDIKVMNIQQKINIQVTSGDIMLENIAGIVNISSTSGDIDLYNIQGKTTLVGTSSDIRVRRIKGDININSTSGDVYAEKVEGNLSVFQSSGDLKAYELQGNIKASSSSGDKIIQQKQGDADLVSSSGDIKITADILHNNRYFMQSTSGDVNLTIPSDADAELKLETTSGDINCKIPMELEIATSKKIEAKLNKGSGQIDIETTSGDITVLGQEK